MSYIRCETKNAVYLINLERHDNFVDSIPPSQPLDAVVVEQNFSEQGSQFLSGIPGIKLTFLETLRSRRMDRRGVNAFFLDPSISREIAYEEIERADKRISRYEVGAGLLKFLSTASGLVAVGKVINNIATKESGERFSRRALLAYGAVGAAIASTYGFSDFLKSSVKTARARGETSLYRRLGLRFRDFVSENHMFFTKYFRDAVVARKLEEIVVPQLRQSVRGKPVIGVYYGVGHGTDLERMLENPTVRAKYLEEGLKTAEGWRRLEGAMVENTREMDSAMFFKWNAVERRFDGPLYYFKGIEGEQKARSFRLGMATKKKEPREVAKADERLTRRDFLKRVFRA